ncbi:23S rRNA (cytidine(2498)-2'-O)-methyltransferase RlmM [Marinobacterium sp. CAU 1594]|nr:23S rRNA (cytidine(2498)-2'-O)-methyltransferase RlmM [Marinobacterium arenosum]
MTRLLLQCRAGFEKEAAGEISDRLSALGIYGYCQLQDDQGYLLFIPHDPGDAWRAVQELQFDELVFVRQWMACTDLLSLARDDRIGQLQAQMDGWPGFTEVWVEYPDTTDGRELAAFSRKFGSALAQQFKRDGRLQRRAPGDALRLQLFVVSGEQIYLGVVPPANSAPWLQGIPRLKFPKDAPSRSTLKLEEAWHWFLPSAEWERRLAAGGTAVDLGAAPGGWTWQLVRRGMFVTAVDNGPMNDDLMATGQVEHCREDGYLYRPDKPVDWMVCDMVDKPARTAAMVVEWALNGWCREAIFNLKLPMKQRYKETASCLQLIDEALVEQGLPYELRAKQLYHDREEVTCHLRLL